MEFIENAKQFLLEARQELRKVTWSTKQHVMASTWVVLGVVVVISIFLGIVDLVLAKVVKYILS
ncbi:MAG: preprotein translocase subunit SecE [Deltaproteobacteria bacterium]|nr:preprotein translocase subunit SecE [Deltaproteobacteria bacterium]